MAQYSLYNDQDLLALLQEGDHYAYELLYQRYFRLLFTHALKRLRDKEQAKDIIQDLFANLWTKRKTLHPKTSLSGYLFTSVNNKIIDHFLREEVAEKYIASLAVFSTTEVAHADHLVREKQLIALIQNEIQQLPPKMREVFELSRNEHLSHKEIAKRLGVSVKTVDRQVSNALYRLKARLGLLILLLFWLK